MSFLLISIVMVSVFASNCMENDFCKAFRRNRYKVDFPFQFIPPNGGSQQNNYWLLVIGTNYWIVNENERQTCSLESTESKSNAFFKNGYQLAFSVWNDKTMKYETAFLRKNERTLHWINLPKTVSKVDDLSDVLGTRSAQWNYTVSPTFTSVSTDNSTFGTVCLLGQKKITSKESRGIEFERNYNCFLIDGKELKQYGNQTRPKGIAKHLPIVGIFTTKAQKSHYQQSSILYSVNKSIQYCYTLQSGFYKECAENSTLKLLVDCKIPQEAVWTYYVIIGQILSIIGFVIFNVYLYVFCCRKDKQNATTVPSIITTSNQNSGYSAEDAKVESGLKPKPSIENKPKLKTKK